MKASIIKKLMVGALTASLVMAPAMSVFASEVNSTVNTVVSSSSSSSSSSSGEATSVAEIPSTSSVAGVTSTVTGVYLAKSVSGSAVATSIASIAEGYGLASNEKPYAKIADLDAKKSPLAKQSLDAAAAAVGGEIGPMLNIELGKMTSGKYSLLPSDGAPIRLSFGIPASFAKSDMTYAVACVRAGGAISILENVSTTPNVITFETTGGAGAYAIIRY